jgi:hypothetical protein
VPRGSTGLHPQQHAGVVAVPRGRGRPSSARSATGSVMESANGNGGSNGRPRLVFFFSKASGRSRRVEGFLSQVLQRRRNHESFDLLNVDVDENADVADRFAIDEVPTIVVIEEKRVQGRLASPRGCRDIEQLLSPWLH